MGLAVINLTVLTGLKIALRLANAVSNGPQHRSPAQTRCSVAAPGGLDLIA